MLETNLSVKAEINLYYDLFLPENLQKPAPLLVAVHGYGAHKRYMMREAVLLAPPSFVIASLQAPHQHFRKTDAGYRNGFGWLTDFKPEESVKTHQKFVADVIENLSDRNLIDANNVFLFGFSQACALNFRYALTYPEALRGIVGVCGGIPSDLETNSSYQPTNAAAFYLYATRDEFYALEKYETFDAKLKNYLPNYQSKSYDAKHEITDAMRADIKNWLAAK